VALRAVYPASFGKTRNSVTNASSLGRRQRTSRHHHREKLITARGVYGSSRPPRRRRRRAVHYETRTESRERFPSLASAAAKRSRRPLPLLLGDFVAPNETGTRVTSAAIRPSRRHRVAELCYKCQIRELSSDYKTDHGRSARGSVLAKPSRNACTRKCVKMGYGKGDGLRTRTDSRKVPRHQPAALPRVPDTLKRARWGRSVRKEDTG